MASRPVPRCEVRSSELAPGRRWQVTYLDAMADGSGIEWTEATWNPTTGCDESAPAATTPSAGWRPRRLRDHRHRPGPGSLRAVEPTAHPGPLRPPRPGRRRPTRPIAEDAPQVSDPAAGRAGTLQQLQEQAGPRVHAEVGDARDLNLPDASVDAVLLLGPLYHLRDRTHRIKALCEAGRIVRPGGRVFAAVISRWAPRLEGVVAERLYEGHPNILALLPDVELTGNLPRVAPDGFSGYTHRPAELVEEIAAAELALEDLVGVEGMPLAASDTRARLDDPAAWQVVLDTARAIERVPELLGLSPHLIATARLPPSQQPC